MCSSLDGFVILFHSVKLKLAKMVLQRNPRSDEDQDEGVPEEVQQAFQE